jgi:hypothetical protein
MINRAGGQLLAIGWLLLLHGLADVAVGVYHVHDVSRSAIDLLASALARSQLCLLSIWLVVGGARWSWRLCTLIGGCCFVFLVLSRLAFPGQFQIGPNSYWLESEWAVFMRPFGPGDLLVKAPILIGLVALPLIAWRVVRWRRHGEPGLSPPRRLTQFQMTDVLIWTVTCSLTFAAIYRTAPYPEWFRQLLDHWRAAYRLQQPGATYIVASSIIYVLLAVLAVWTVNGPARANIMRWIAMAVTAVMVTGLAAAFDLWRTAADIDHLPRHAELATSILAAVFVVGSLYIVRLWEHLSNRVAALREGRGTN